MSSPNSNLSWLEQVTNLLVDHGVDAGAAETLAKDIEALNAPIDPDTTLIGSEAGSDLLKLLVAELKRRLSTPSVVQKMSAGEMEMVRKLLTDNTVTLAGIRKGDFGEVAQKAAEEYPFPEGSRVVPIR